MMLVGLTRVDPITLFKTFNIPTTGGCIPPERVGAYTPTHCPMTIVDMGGTAESELRHQLWWLEQVENAVKRMGPGTDDAGGGTAAAIHTARALVFREDKPGPGASAAPPGHSCSNSGGGPASGKSAGPEPCTTRTSTAAKLMYALLFVSRDKVAAASMEEVFAQHSRGGAAPDVLLRKYGTCNVFNPSARD